MNKIKIILALLIFLTSITGNSQSTPGNLTQPGKIEATENSWLLVDPQNGDTTRYYFQTNRFLKKSKTGVLLIEGYKLGGTGTLCGCEPLPHGFWMERYPNGAVKEHGSYICDHKTGTWISYYENGQIAKVENYTEPYPEAFTRRTSDWDTLKQSFLLDGPYRVYYPNGQLKVEGTYKIVEEHITTDTLLTFDPETYEEKIKIIKGDFWIPKTKKCGYWNTYAADGNLLSREYYDLETNEKIRSIEKRYLEIYSKLAQPFKKE